MAVRNHVKEMLLKRKKIDSTKERFAIKIAQWQALLKSPGEIECHLSALKNFTEYTLGQ